MIVEGVVTTTNADGSTNIAPMGPIIDGNELVLRPFSTSTTYQNLQHRPEGVFHITDNVLLIAAAAIGKPDAKLVAVDDLSVMRLQDCCRWKAFRLDSTEWGERATLKTRTVSQGRVRDFFGFNRAKHAVLEATILATRVHLIDHDEIRLRIETLRPLVEKTAGEQEIAAFALVEEAINQSIHRQSTC